MGMLDQILGGLAGNVLGRSSGNAAGGGSSRVLMALLPVVLSMLANRRGGTNVGQPQDGGLGGLFGGGGGGGGLGGLADIIGRFTQKGYGSQANSWVGTGTNEPLSPQALSDVLGPQQLSDIASQAGISDDEARDGLSQLLPEVVDHLTPQGQLPPQDQLLSSIDEFERRLAG